MERQNNYAPDILTDGLERDRVHMGRDKEWYTGEIEKMVNAISLHNTIITYRFIKSIMLRRS